jgi:uncharacterized membrane protein YgdD (TMEM256/DUF423 family)
MKTMGVAAAWLGLSGVLAGALGAHALRDVLSSEAMVWWNKAVFYQLVHAPVLLVLSRCLLRTSKLRFAAGSLLLGVVLFSGSLYGLALTQWKLLVWLTPLGGTLMVLGWAVLAIHFSGTPDAADEETRA